MEEARAGGRLVSGFWPFSSGCQYADWIAGFCVPVSNGKPVLSEAGRPQIQAAWLPAHEWQIEDLACGRPQGYWKPSCHLEEQIGSRLEFF
jgi:hypothetical protein